MYELGWGASVGLIVAGAILMNPFLVTAGIVACIIMLILS